MNDIRCRHSAGPWKWGRSNVTDLDALLGEPRSQLVDGGLVFVR